MMSKLTPKQDGHEEIHWSPNDFSPCYVFDVDENKEFVRLRKVFDIPTFYPGHKEMELKQHYIDYMSGEGFEKYKSQRTSIYKKILREGI